jgi:uncharacterized GH25 family protein
MNFKLTAFVLATSLATALPLSAHAHRAWMLPSATVISGNNAWVTVDGAISNDLFYFEHHPLRLDNLSVLAPDGTAAKVENTSTGRYRSTFDVQLSQPGTYKMAVTNSGLNASYKENGQPKRWRGTAENFAKQVPANAEDLRVTQSQSRVETFVTAGKPTTTTLKPTGSGLELAPVTHPNDLFVGDTANFQLLLDGKPAADVEVSVVPSGVRYRDKLNDMTLKTNAEGKFSVKWTQPGMWFIEADVRDNKTALPQAKERRASYAATFEVLPQ